MNDIFNNLNRWMNGLNSQDWLLVLVGVLAIGFLLLQGFGSRKNY